MTGIGPVEPVNSSDPDESQDVVGNDAPRLTDRLAHRWAGLSSRARTAVLATSLAAATAAAALLIPPALGPDRPAEPPVPWPANVTTWRYLGLATPYHPGAGSGRFLFAVAVDHGPPVSLKVTGTAFDGLTARALPRPSFFVPGGTTLRMTVELSVSDCSELPRKADFPSLEVTLSNTRAVQNHSYVFGGAFSRDLSTLIQGACDQVTHGVTTP